MIEKSGMLSQKVLLFLCLKNIKFSLKNLGLNGLGVKVKRSNLIVLPKVLLHLILILMSFSGFESVFQQRICEILLKALMKTQVELFGKTMTCLLLPHLQKLQKPICVWWQRKNLHQTVMWVDFKLVHFLGDTLLRIEIFSNYMVRTQRRSPLNTNLTKWLSKCEGSLLKGKRKIQVNVDWTWNETYKHDGNWIDNGGK